MLLLLYCEATVALKQHQPVRWLPNFNPLQSKSSLGYMSPSSPFDTIIEAPTSSSSSKIQIRQASPLSKNHQEKVSAPIPAFDSQPHDNDNGDNGVTLIPMSTEPLMFWSSKPLLTLEECQVLSEYFYEINKKEQQLPEKDSLRRRDSMADDDRAKRVLRQVWQQIDRLTFSPSHVGESSRPNYLFYSPQKEPSEDEKSNDNSWLFPHGLHVDTNNGKLFRHLTILLYLTTPHNTKGGATSFPLAKPIEWNRRTIDSNSRYDETEEEAAENTLLQAADALVRTKLHHTQFSKNEQMQYYGHVLEEAAVNVFQRDDQLAHDTASAPTMPTSPLGLRVIPKAGHICVFSNLLDSGECDPRSFHGAEQLFQTSCPAKAPHEVSAMEPADQTVSTISSGNKEVLTFFKEIPLQQFSNHEEFGQRVADSRRRLQQRYLSKHDFRVATDVIPCHSM